MAKFQTLPHSTRNDLPAATRARVGVLLNARLADTIDLQLQAKQAHWNVKGPNFIALHELFDKVADAAEEASDCWPSGWSRSAAGPRAPCRRWTSARRCVPTA